jgi:integrase
MAGKVRTREKCPKCGRAFTIIEELDIHCPTCDTRPKTFFIFLYWDGDKHRIARDPDKNILDSYRRAHRLLEKIRSEIDAGTFNIANYLPKETEQFRGHVLFPKWLEYIKSKGNAKSYLRKIDQYTEDHFIPRLGQLNLRDIKTYHVEDFRQYISGTYRNQRTGTLLAPKSVKNVMDALKEFCHWLHRREVIARVPYFDVVRVPERLIEIMPLTDRERAISAIQSDRLKNIISFLALHPVRPSESAALDVRHFNLTSRIVTIEQALDSDRSIKTRKSRKAYEIPLSSLWDASCVSGRFGKEIAFPNKIGARYSAHTLNEAWKRACERAEVPYVSLYPSTRHTTATSYAARGASEEQIEGMLGHSTRGMSKKYVKRSVEMLRHLVDGTQVVQIEDLRKAK